MQRNIALLVEYDGSNFYGFQKQKDFRTVQQELEFAINKFSNETVSIINAGRTDTGVHALYQVINFVTQVRREMQSWVRGINTFLSNDIVIRQAQEVELGFNARYSAVSRTYYYYLNISATKSAIWHKKVGWYYHKLNIEQMAIACKKLVGMHDFSSFRASSCQALNPVRNMSICNLTILKNDIIKFEFRANAFLYHMIRNIMGALIYVGNDKLSLNGFIELIEAKNRKKAPPTFMPDGLYFANVEYAKEYFNYKTIKPFT